MIIMISDCLKSEFYFFSCLKKNLAIFECRRSQTWRQKVHSLPRHPDEILGNTADVAAELKDSRGWCSGAGQHQVRQRRWYWGQRRCTCYWAPAAQQQRSNNVMLDAMRRIAEIDVTVCSAKINDIVLFQSHWYFCRKKAPATTSKSTALSSVSKLYKSGTHRPRQLLKLYLFILAWVLFQWILFLCSESSPKRRLTVMTVV